MNTNLLEVLQNGGYVAIVAALTYILGELFKKLLSDAKYIPYINVGIGLVSAGICFWIGMLPVGTPIDIVMGIFACVISALGAGGFYDVLGVKKTVERPADEMNEDIVDHEIHGEG